MVAWGGVRRRLSNNDVLMQSLWYSTGTSITVLKSGVTISGKKQSSSAIPVVCRPENIIHQCRGAEGRPRFLACLINDAAAAPRSLGHEYHSASQNI
ncbi:unnamed protein product [Sphagnum jensenii]|uniref:Uncharacterized protein n=1 Tax=Sphagnum jensenii TaxID=128206 RepID=A0ABP1BVT9_9BRYO